MKPLRIFDYSGRTAVGHGIMNAKVEKNLRNGVNRWSNCDVANLGKAVEAAQSQIEAIRRLERMPGWTLCRISCREDRPPAHRTGTVAGPAGGAG